MKKLQITFLFVLSMTLFMACKEGKQTKAKQQTKAETTQPTQRIVSLNGALTAAICELGHGDELVGRDVTSTYPKWVEDSVKNLGHVRTISVEGILALNPTLIVASASDMNPKIEKKLKASGIDYKLFERTFSVEGSKKLIKEVATLIGSDKTPQIVSKIDQQLAKRKSFGKQPKVLFIYARGAGTMMVAGKETSMASMIEIAGGENAAKGISGFKPLTAEALLSINPDVFLFFESGLGSLGGMQGLLKVPGVAETNAGKNKAVITIEGGLLSNFGPRVGKGALVLNQALAPYAK